MILEGEIKDAKISSFSSDFQTLIKRKFPLYFFYELLMSLRSLICTPLTYSSDKGQNFFKIKHQKKKSYLNLYLVFGIKHTLRMFSQALVIVIKP